MHEKTILNLVQAKDIEVINLKLLSMTIHLRLSVIPVCIAYHVSSFIRICIGEGLVFLNFAICRK